MRNLAWLVGLLLWVAAGCDSSGSERREARRFLESYRQLNEAVGDEGRRARLEALRELPLHGQAADEARDVCVRAHAALLDAEAEQEKAARMFDELLDGAGGEPLDPARTAPVQQGIERSERALQEARAHYSQCEDAARALAVRYAKR